MRMRIWLWAVLALLAACDSEDASSDASTANHPDAATHDAATHDAAASSSPLPAAFKGYELYAWDEGAEVAYTLITGTNRQKTLAEIMAHAPDVNDGALVVIHGRGLDDLERLLARVPAGTDVIFSELAGLPALSDAHQAAVAKLVQH